MAAVKFYTLEQLEENRRIRSKRWAAANVDYRREYMKEWRRQNPLKAVLQGLASGARIRARRKGMEHDWVALDLKRLYNSLVNNMQCPCCGVEMTANVEQGVMLTAISLDRVNNEKGYIDGNVQVICRKCNTQKKNMSQRDLENLLSYIKRFL